MSARSKILLAAVAALCLAGRASAQLSVGAVNRHTHSSDSDGGSTLAPLILAMPAPSTASFSGEIEMLPGARASGFAGLVVGSSVGISGATSTTIGGLDGQSLGKIHISIVGTMNGADGMAILPNDDTAAHYNGVCHTGQQVTFEGFVWATSSGLQVSGTTYGVPNYISVDAWLATATGQERGFHSGAGFNGAYLGHTECGGVWLDSTTPLSSITVTYAGTFTGSITIYQD